MAKQITDQTALTTADANDVVLIRDVSAGSDKKTTVAGLAAGVGVNIPSGAISYAQTNGKIWWEEIGRTTLASAGDTITVSSLPARKYLRIVIMLSSTSPYNISAVFTLNGDTAANYAYRTSDNGGADSPAMSQNSINITAAASINDIFFEAEFFNVSSKEKGFIGQGYINVGNGASVQIIRVEKTGKWANTSNQISSITVTNSGTADFAIGSEVIVMGHD